MVNNMTALYEMTECPPVLGVHCPDCAAHARFEFARVVRITRREDLGYFKAHPAFEYKFCRESHVGMSWHAALFFEGLHGTLAGLSDLPQGYVSSDWARSSTWRCRLAHFPLGTLTCKRCRSKRRHELSWPNDAWFQCEIRGELLWAFDRTSALMLRDYLASDDRKTGKYEQARFLRYIPSKCKTAKVRALVLKKLGRLLESS